jgi:hypothetical protein
MQTLEENLNPGGGAMFATTHWSVVLRAGDCQVPEPAEALEKL